MVGNSWEAMPAGGMAHDRRVALFEAGYAVMTEQPLNIETREEVERGCGFRMAGGIYLVTDGIGKPCGRLPIPLGVCPTCAAGIKPARGWTWIASDPLIGARRCRLEGVTNGLVAMECDVCPLNPDCEPYGRVGLLWVGEKFYAEPVKFTLEAMAMGVSRKISTVPKDFELGTTWVWLAHRKAIANEDGSHTAGVFHAFKPERLEYVIKDTDPMSKLERLQSRGFTLVRVVRTTREAQRKKERANA